MQKAAQIRENVKKVIIGKDEIIDLVLTSILAGGHILLEDMPGSGKTMLAKAVAKSMKAEFSRIQMTPDLLPSDVTGLNIYNQKSGEFEFHPGPVFTNLLLADEINRATPRTQASLLECMEEKQVTIDGETRKLEDPFCVIATQNPIETAGTFQLPEAQLDRFLMKLSMGMVSEEEEKQILLRYMTHNPYDTLEPVVTKEELKAVKSQVPQVYIHLELLNYLQQICIRTREEKDIQAGVSVRGTLAYRKAVQAYALLHDREYAVPEDVKKLAVPVLAHRLVMENGFFGSREAEHHIEQIVEKIPVPTESWKKA